MGGESPAFVLVDYEAAEWREHVPELAEGTGTGEFVRAEVYEKHGEGSVDV